MPAAVVTAAPEPTAEIYGRRRVPPSCEGARDWESKFSAVEWHRCNRACNWIPDSQCTSIVLGGLRTKWRGPVGSLRKGRFSLPTGAPRAHLEMGRWAADPQPRFGHGMMDHDKADGPILHEMFCKLYTER